MPVEWNSVLDRLRSYPPKVQRLQPPCPPERLRDVEAELGEVPSVLVEMFGYFNGAKLFFRRMPSITLFGISVVPPLPPLQWAPGWYVDKFTPVWRKESEGRERDWVIAIKNYGGLAILGNDGVVREWDTSMKRWNDRMAPFADWIEQVLRDGEIMLRESGE